MSTPTIEQRIAAQERAADGKMYVADHLLTADELRRVLMENEQLKPAARIVLEYQANIDATVSLAKELGCDCGDFRTRLDWIRRRALEGTEIKRINDLMSPLKELERQRDQWREVARALATTATAYKTFCPADEDTTQVFQTATNALRAALARFDSLAREETK